MERVRVKSVTVRSPCMLTTLLQFAKLILQIFTRTKISITKGPPAHIMDQRMYLSTDQFLLVHGGLQLSMASPTAKPVMLQGGLPIRSQWGKKNLKTKSYASKIILFFYFKVLIVKVPYMAPTYKSMLIWFFLHSNLPSTIYRIENQSKFKSSGVIG